MPSVTETCTVIVTPRDRFSIIETCIEKILEHTPEPFELIVVMGGAPENLKQALHQKYGSKAKLVFEPAYLNTAQLRNIGLRLARTRLAVCLDTDVYVRPGWLGPLLDCQRETGAGLVVPMVLDKNDVVHTAGNDLFITTKGGQKFCTMELRYAQVAVGETTNLKRREIDFGEVHCHLLIVDAALKLGVYDETYREGSDIDSGLTLAKAGHSMWVEPSSVVYLYYPDRLDEIDDVRYYLWKWDLAATRASFDYFKKKWGMDRTGRDGASMTYYEMVVRRVGKLTRLWPIPAVLRLDNFYYRSRKNLRRALRA